MCRDYSRTNDTQKAYWKCKCVCGNERITDSYSLTTNLTYDCGKQVCVDNRDHVWSVKNMIGKVFGRLKVISQAEGQVNSQVLWFCECSCGNTVTVQGGNLRNGNSRSCGCRKGATHAMSHLPEYKTWESIKQRCYNINKKEYKYYGGRGIVMSDVWKNDFPSFYQHVGKKPSPEYSLDRIDGEKGYEPGNVKWATPYEQWDNRKKRGLCFSTYQYEARKTAIYSKGDKQWDIAYCLLGLGEESGEVLGKYKKCIRDNDFILDETVKNSMIKECGDVLWYLSQLCNELGTTLDHVAQVNLDKLKKRVQNNTLHGSGDER